MKYAVIISEYATDVFAHDEIPYYNPAPSSYIHETDVLRMKCSFNCILGDFVG